MKYYGTNTIADRSELKELLARVAWQMEDCIPHSAKGIEVAVTVTTDES